MRSLGFTVFRIKPGSFRTCKAPSPPLLHFSSRLRMLPLSTARTQSSSHPESWRKPPLSAPGRCSHSGLILGEVPALAPLLHGPTRPLCPYARQSPTPAEEGPLSTHVLLVPAPRPQPWCASHRRCSEISRDSGVFAGLEFWGQCGGRWRMERMTPDLLWPREALVPHYAAGSGAASSSHGAVGPASWEHGGGALISLPSARVTAHATARPQGARGPRSLGSATPSGTARAMVNHGSHDPGAGLAQSRPSARSC